MLPSPWLPYRRPAPAARVRLFCFPHAGGSAAAYLAWGAYLPRGVELCAVEPPGRGARIGEAPLGRMDALMAALLPALAPMLDRPFAFFGHSMGAWIAYEAARRLMSEGRGPSRLFVSGRPPPGVGPSLKRLAGLSDAALAAELRRYGATPAEVLDNPEFLAAILPAVRADFSLVAAYEAEAERAVLDCPISAFGGADDSLVDEAGLKAWAGLTRAGFALRLFPGGHFYIGPEARAVAGEIARILEGA